MRTATLLACGLILAWPCIAAEGDCPPYKTPVVLGYPDAPGLSELSGLVASRRNPGVLWVHNDSGGSPSLYALHEDGRLLASFELGGVSAVDWEDISFGPGPSLSADYLYVGDIGDNAFSRPYVTVYRVQEPAVSPDQDFLTSTLTDIATYRLQFPEAPARVYNSEAMAVDPIDGTLYLFTKDSLGADAGYSHVFRNAAALEDGATIPLELATSVFTGTGLFHYVTAADIAPIGNALLLRTYTEVLYWPRAAGASLSDALGHSPCSLPSPPDVQAEAIGFAPDGRNYYTVSEQPLGDPEPIYLVEAYEEEGDSDCANTLGGFFETGDSFCLRIPDSREPALPYQWFRDDVPLESDGRILGAASRSLSIGSLVEEDSGAYTCTYEGPDKATHVFGPVHITVSTDVPAAGAYGLILAATALAGAAARAIRRRMH